MCEEIREFLACPVCFASMLDARVLPCGHTFCLSCLLKLDESEDQVQLLCPTCRSVCRGQEPSLLPKNFLVIQMACKVATSEERSQQEAKEKTQLQAESAADDSLRFHSRCGRSIRLSRDCRVAKRDRREFQRAILLSSRPLRAGETFEVQLEETCSRWSGCLKIGVSSRDPRSLELPDSLSELGVGFVVAYGLAVYKDGRGVGHFGGVDLDDMEAGDRLGVRLLSTGRLQLLLNGRDIGVKVRGFETPQWAMVDLYGKAVKVSIRSQSSSQPESLELSSDAEQQQQQEDSNILRFHRLCGRSLRLFDDRKTAARDRRTFRNAVAFSCRPLRLDEYFAVRLEEKCPGWRGSIRIGVSAQPPERLEQQPESFDELHREGFVCLQDRSVWVNGRLVNRLDVDLNSLIPGSQIGICHSSGGRLRLFVDNRDLGVVARGIDGQVWAMVDLFGQAVKVSIVTLPLLPTNAGRCVCL